MAKVTISGDVKDVGDYHAGKYVNVWEHYVGSDGKERNRLWTLWLIGDPGIMASDWLEAEGILSTSVNEWTKEGVTRQIVNHSLNSVSIIKHNPTIPKIAERSQDDDDLRKYGNGLAPF
jgi:hypothetical protein